MRNNTERLFESIYDKLADNDEYKIFDPREVDDMRLVYNMENEPIIEIIKDGKRYVLTIIETEIEE